MRIVRSHRSLIAWILYACVLYSALLCSIHHGQQSALQLGIGGSFCSMDHKATAGVSRDTSDSKTPSLMPSLGCPLCSAFMLSVVALLLLSWLLRPASKTFARSELRSNTSSRVPWPPLNPRAP
ncbi:DUF2946 domain-containing protein [Pseudomonas putida]